ncbi:hypothetical protein SAMN05444360_12624 [Chryseobacterium carnipullorum]|uniref:hypothetical protein n=1 Tax=Chryseobacterium carnipullorum TaxID=1124835 RepID=UPI00091B4020|nr:hypothetical protein [Chryseobacterium carnipullorum]SHN00846.1 hypothetical protein SAMN05444360_12624 [Chryseobacterium carnipullorum]
MNAPKYVNFEILKLEDIRKTGSTVAIGKVLRGLYYESSNTAFFSDQNGQDWTFYVNDTCRIIEQ